MRLSHSLFFLALAAFIVTSPVTVSLASAEEQSIVAVVNDDIISNTDLDERVRFVLLTTGLTDSAEVRERLKPQVLRQLVDEALQMQEATKLGVTVSEADMNEAIATVEQQRGIPPGGIIAKLKSERVPTDTYYRQIRAQVAWSRIVMQKIRPTVKISDDEIERARRVVTDTGGEVSEYQIAVLQLPIDRPGTEAQAKALADKLVSEIKAGAAFDKVARELAGAGASGAPDATPFWVRADQLDPAIVGVLSRTRQGEVTAPIRTPGNYSIVKFVAAKKSYAAGNDNEVLLKDILMSLKPTAKSEDADLLLNIANELSRHPGDCNSKGIGGIENTDDVDIAVKFARARVSELADALKQIVGRLNVGEMSKPFATSEGIRLFMLCERTEAPPKLTPREETQQRLYSEKMTLEAQKYLRNLQREAFVDVRL